MKDVDTGYRDTLIAQFLQTGAIETEQKMARLRVGIGVLAIAISPYLVTMKLLEPVMDSLLYLGFILAYLIYALTYYMWAPYRRFSLVLAARVSTVIDFAAVTVVLVNSGGLDSPFWALWATVALTYVIRFHFGTREGIVTALLFLGTVELCRLVIPTTGENIPVVLVGVGFSLIVLIAGGLLLVHSEREAVRRALTVENEAIHRIVNTVQHAVNNPLAIVSGNLQLLKRRQTGEKEQEWIGAAEEALTSIGDALGQLRELEDQRLTVGRGPLRQYSLDRWYDLPAGSGEDSGGGEEET